MNSPYILRKEKCVIVWLIEGWLSCLEFFCVPSEIATQDEVSKLPAWLWLVITFLLSILYLFPFTVAQALLSTSVCECKDITQLLCTQANGKLHVPTASGSCILWQWQLPVVPAGHLLFTLPVNLLGSRGRHFVCINTLMRFFSVSVPCKGRDDDGIPPCECVVAQALWEELNVAVTSAALGRDRTSTPISPPEQGLNQKK